MTMTHGAGAVTSRVLIVALVMALGVLASPVSSHAVPHLQLDVSGGYYDTATQTIIATADRFTLYAILTPDGHGTTAEQLAQRYYISAAVVPQTGPLGADLGSFRFNGTTVNVTQDMIFGVPPIEANLTAAGDEHDLGSHGVFDTYFSEFGFGFDANVRAAVYDTAETPGGPSFSPSGFSYVVAFEIDTSGLTDGYAIHFDLYNEVVRSNGDIDRMKFAPFTHDAQSPPHRVPEVETLLLLGSGLVIAGLGLSRRRGPRR